jgi:putative colanic acid biosynthesis acetyltransferase WcaF
LTVSETKRSRVRIDLFNNRKGFDLGRPRFLFLLWYAVKCIFFLSPLPWPSRLKSWILRCFGAGIGRGVYWKPRVNVHIPWKLKVGDYTLVGEEVCIMNFAPVAIGAQCCLSQRCFLSAANHDHRSPEMEYRHAPIVLEDGVWVGACAFVGPGVIIGVDAFITAMSLVTRSLEGGWVYSGNPCAPVRRRWTEN